MCFVSHLQDHLQIKSVLMEMNGWHYGKFIKQLILRILTETFFSIRGIQLGTRETKILVLKHLTL